jgi:hypothetical protein
MNKGVDTMSKIRLLLSTALVLALSTAPLHAAPPNGDPAAEADVSILLSAIRANRKALVAINLQLTDEESAKFWPVYDRYQKDINELGDRLVSLIGDYTASFSDMTNDKAMKIVDDYLTIDAERVKVKRSYVEEFARILPGRKVARFYQIENKMDAVLRFDLASTIPVIDDASGAPAE